MLLVRGRTKAAPGTRATSTSAPRRSARLRRVAGEPRDASSRGRTQDQADRSGPATQSTSTSTCRIASGQARRAEVTLYAVDEGVLSLIGYKTPDPSRSSRRRDPPRGHHRVARSARVPFNPCRGKRGSAARQGARGRRRRRRGRGSPRLPTRARTSTRRWSPTRAGHAHASFKLPDSLTTYRLMAVAAAEDDRFGSPRPRRRRAVHSWRVPRSRAFLRAGDAIDAGIVLTSKGLPKTKVDREAIGRRASRSMAARARKPSSSNPMARPRCALLSGCHASASQGHVPSQRRRSAEDSVEISRAVRARRRLEAVALYGDTTRAARREAGRPLVDAERHRRARGLGVVDGAGGPRRRGRAARRVPVRLHRTAREPAGAAALAARSRRPTFISRSPLTSMASSRRRWPKSWPTSATTAASVSGPTPQRSLPWVSVYALRALGEAKRHQVDIPSEQLDARHRVRLGDAGRLGSL